MRRSLADFCQPWRVFTRDRSKPDPRRLQHGQAPLRYQAQLLARDVVRFCVSLSGCLVLVPLICCVGAGAVLLEWRPGRRRTCVPRQARHTAISLDCPIEHVGHDQTRALLHELAIPAQGSKLESSNEQTQSAFFQKLPSEIRDMILLQVQGNTYLYVSNQRIAGRHHAEEKVVLIPLEHSPDHRSFLCGLAQRANLEVQALDYLRHMRPLNHSHHWLASLLWTCHRM